MTPAPILSNCDLSLIIACYREEGHIEQSVVEILRTLESTRYSFELIFIEDNGGDGTSAIVQRIARDDDRMSVVLHGANVGRGATVTEGFRLARGRIVGFLDIDLEVHCRYIPSMIEAIDAGYDGATAYRIYKPQLRYTSILRSVLSRGYRMLFRSALDVPFQDTEAGYKFFNRAKIMPVLEETQHKGWFWDTEIMVLAHMHGLSILEIPCAFVQRKDKASTVRVLPDTLDHFRSLWNFRKRVADRAPFTLLDPHHKDQSRAG